MQLQRHVQSLLQFGALIPAGTLGSGLYSFES
jgi:hypothetical protein